MAMEAGNDDGEANQNTVFIDTSLDTHLATMVSDSDTVSDLKKKIMLEHRQCFPEIEDIKIHCLKVKRRGNFYHLSDSMLVKSAFGAAKRNWFVSVDASRSEQYGGVQHRDKHKAGDQLALPWVVDGSSIDRHDSHADRPLKLSLVHGSPSMHPKIVPFVNQKLPSIDHSTSGDSCKDVSKNIEEYRSSNDDHWRNLEQDPEKQLDSKVQEKLYTVNKEIKSKKRIRDVCKEGSLEDALGSGPSVKKKRKTRRIEGNAKDSEEDRVLTYDTDKVPYMGASINDENSFEHKSNSKDTTLDGVVTKTLSDEHARNMLVSQKKINGITKGENYSAIEQVAVVVPFSVEDVGEETHPRKNTEASEIVPDIAMVAEKNMQQDMSIGMSQKEKCEELVQKAVIGNEVPSSSTRTSNCEHEAPGVTAVSHRKGAKRSTKHKAAEKEVSSTPFIKKLHNINKDAIDTSQQDLGSTGQEFAGDQIDKLKEDKEFPLNKGPEVKLPERSKDTMGGENTGASKRKKVKKSTVKNKDESLVKHADNLVADISSAVPVPVFDEKIIDERKNEVSEKTLIDDSLVNASKIGDDLIVKEVKVSEPTESHKSQVHLEDVEEKSKDFKETVGSRRKKKDAGKSASRNNESVVKHANDAANGTNGTNEETLLPHVERKENLEITSIDSLHVHLGGNDDNLMENDVQISRTEEISKVNTEGINDGSKTENEKMDDSKKTKKKKKTKKSSGRNEDESITKHANPVSDGHLHEIANEGAPIDTDGDKVKGKTAPSFDEGLLKKAKKNHKSSVMSHSDLPSKHQSTELELEPEKIKSIEHHPLPEETSKNVIMKNVSSEVNIAKDGSHEIDFKNYFEPSQQPNQIASIDKVKDKTLSGREKKIKDSAIQSLSKNESSKDPKISNLDDLKTSKRTRKIDASKTSKSARANKGRESSSSSEPFDRSLHIQKSNKQQSIVVRNHGKTLKKSAPVVNSSRNVKSLLNTPGTIFGGGSDESSADDNATVNSDSSTRTPSGKSSSSGESAPSIDSRRNGTMKRKEGGGKNSIISQSRLKNISMGDLLRSSSRFKKAKFTASQQVEDTESQPVDFVPESQP